MNDWMPAILAFVAVAFGVITLALLTEGIRTMKRRSDMQKRLGKAIEGCVRRPHEWSWDVRKMGLGIADESGFPSGAQRGISLQKGRKGRLCSLMAARAI